jgi:protein involved in polysaccharide export with SLBB domain
VSSASITDETLPGGQVLSRAITPDYVLGPGDGIAVSIWGEYEEKSDARVAPDGKINLPTVGMVMVKGLTLTQTHELIDLEVKKYYRNVKTGVSLTSLRVFQISVLGHVLMPGAYTATPVRRVSDAIGQAGGILSGGSSRSIQLQRNGQVVALADLVAFNRKGDQATNPELRDGDVIFVPSMGDQRVLVYVSEVATPSGGPGGGGSLSENSVPYIIEVKNDDHLADVFSQLGALSPWWDLDSVFIDRPFSAPEGTMRIPTNLQRYFLEKDESQNPLIRSGDQIYVPALIRRVFVTGAVRVPAAYVYSPGKSADTYIAEAGGASLVADFGRSFIKRADGSIVPYSGTSEVNNGDTIVVLEKFFKTWQDYFALVGTITGVILSAVGFYAAITGFGR